MSRAILNTLRMVSLRKTGPWRLLRILLTLETSSPTPRAISTCVITIPPQSGNPLNQQSVRDGSKISSRRRDVKENYGLFTHKVRLPGRFSGGRAGGKIRFCLRRGSLSIVITHLFAGVRRHEFWG